jgi:hypothetical protein
MQVCPPGTVAVPTHISMLAPLIRRSVASDQCAANDYDPYRGPRVEVSEATRSNVFQSQAPKRAVCFTGGMAAGGPNHRINRSHAISKSTMSILLLS